ncbi:hypothetical protein Tco_0982863 [Tanacetum coccineum]
MKLQRTTEKTIGTGGEDGADDEVTVPELGVRRDGGAVWRADGGVGGTGASDLGSGENRGRTRDYVSRARGIWAQGQLGWGWVGGIVEEKYSVRFDTPIIHGCYCGSPLAHNEIAKPGSLNPVRACITARRVGSAYGGGLRGE